MPPHPKPSRRKSKGKKKSVSQRKILETLLDRLVSQIVILRDGGCVTPGKCSGRLTCSHYYGRTKKRVRWDLRNCNCQCSKHNLRHNNFQSYYGEYMLTRYSMEDLVELAQLANFEGWKFSVSELEQMVEEYQKIYIDLLGKQPSVQAS